MEEQLMDPGMDQGMDIDGQIAAGVEAFVQSQDPAIAVEVCNMLAQQMGIAPELDPYSDQAEPGATPPAAAPAAAPPAAGGGAPMAGNGLRIYKRGGKIQKFANGGAAGPKPKKTTPKPITSQLTTGGVNTTKVFNPQDMNQSRAQRSAGVTPSVQNRYTTPGLSKSLNEIPAKGAMRQNIQDIGMSRGDISQGGGYMIGDKVAYDFGKRKGELAGEMNPVSFQVPAYEHTLPGIPTELIDLPPDLTGDLPGQSSITPGQSSGTPRKSMDEIRAQGKRYGKADADPVAWVKGQKSGPNGFKATKNYRYKDRFKHNLKTP